MKKYLLISLVAVALLSSGGSVSAAVCDAPGGGKLGYCPLEPIPGLTLGNASVDLPMLLTNLFRVLFSVGALMAVVTLVLGGISYMTSTIVDVKLKAKERLWAALYGLLILAGSYLILVTINPQLVVFNFTVPKTQYQAGTITKNNNTNTKGPGVVTNVRFSRTCSGFNSSYEGITLYLDGAQGLPKESQRNLLKICTSECQQHGGKIFATGDDTDSFGSYWTYQCSNPTH